MKWTAQSNFQTNVLAGFVRGEGGAKFMVLIMGATSLSVLVMLLFYVRTNQLADITNMGGFITHDFLLALGVCFGISVAFGGYFATMHGMNRTANFFMFGDMTLSTLGAVLPNIPTEVPDTEIKWVTLSATMLLYVCIAIVPPMGVKFFSARVHELTVPNGNNIVATEVANLAAELQKTYMRKLRVSVKMQGFTKKQQRELKKMSLDEQEAFFRKPPAEQTKYFADKKGGAFNVNFSRKTG